MLAELGATLGAADPIDPAQPDDVIATALADRLQRAGYEAIPTQRGGQAQVEAFNCVFHAMARQNRDVCRFDIAYMEAASGRRIQHAECIVRGGHACRFLIGHAPPPER
jgi:predicted ArsR family transcriptional regulator